MPERTRRTVEKKISRLDTSKALRDVLRVSVAADAHAALSEVARRAADITESDGAYVESVNRERDEVVATAVFGRNLPPLNTRGPYRGSVAEAAIRRQKPILVPDIARESRSILGSIRQRLPALVLPLALQERTIGVLILLRKTPRFRSAEIAELQVYSDVAAMVLHRSMLLAEAEERQGQLQEALRSRNEVLRIVAHDLRNPINTINLGMAALETKRISAKRRAQTLAVIHRSIERIHRLLQDLADVAKIERGVPLPLRLQLHSVRDLGQEVCGRFAVGDEQNVPEIVCKADQDAVVCVDRDRLLQALHNVIDNAVKFTPKHGRVAVTTEVTTDQVRFVISDTGPGIKKADQERIFDPYWQARSTAHLGSGLGLAITKKIVEQHGGRITVESELKKGTTFIITVPRYRHRS